MPLPLGLARLYRLSGSVLLILPQLAATQDPLLERARPDSWHKQLWVLPCRGFA